MADFHGCQDNPRERTNIEHDVAAIAGENGETSRSTLPRGLSRHWLEQPNVTKIQTFTIHYH
jgi:hypothetical protein